MVTIAWYPGSLLDREGLGRIPGNGIVIIQLLASLILSKSSFGCRMYRYAATSDNLK